MSQHSDALELSLTDEGATRELAQTLARLCRPGEVILLRGPIGAGKTTFVDAFAKELGAAAATSPTFVIAHAYRGGRIPVWHLDLYRLSEPRLVDELDLDQYLSPDAITLVEWPEHAGDAWPADRLEIKLAVVQQGRTATLRGFGKTANRVAALQAASAQTQSRT